MKNWVVLFFVVLVALSCEKDKDLGAGKENKGIPLISSQVYGTSESWTCTYNENNLPFIVKTKWSYKVFFYDNENRLSGYDVYEDARIYSNNWIEAQEAMNRKNWVNPINTDKSLHAAVSYTNTKITVKITPYDITSSHEIYTDYIYDTNNRIIQAKRELSLVEYNYDSEGNLSNRNHFFLDKDEPSLYTSVEFQYDDHPNPFIVFNKIPQPGLFTNKNNIIRETVTIYSNDLPDDVQVKETFYEYNSKGYPVKKDGIVTYEYIND